MNSPVTDRRKIMNETRERKSTFWQGVGNIIKKSLENYIVVSHEGVTKFKVSIFTFVLLFLLLHGAVLVAMVVSLFFGVKYSFAGKDDLSRVNRVMETAGDRASEWWSGHRYSTYRMISAGNMMRRRTNDRGK